MTLEYANGKTIEGVVLCRTESAMRVALRGHNDVVELMQVDGQWISEDRQPVRIQNPCRARAPLSQSAEDDLVCPEEVVSELVELVRQGVFDASRSAKRCRLM